MRKKAAEETPGVFYSRKVDESISKLDKRQIAEAFLEHLSKEHKISEKEIIEILSKKSYEKIRIPISIFHNRKLSPLECVAKYLKEQKDLSYHEIASLLKRDDRTIWTTYSNACKKTKESLAIKEPEFSIPLHILADRKLSILESIVLYLETEFNLSIRKIAEILGRDSRNIWTVHSRALKKIQKMKKMGKAGIRQEDKNRT